MHFWGLDNAKKKTLNYFNSLELGKKVEKNCKVIKPFINGTLNIDLHVKCEIESNECTEKNKEFSEIINKTSCKDHTLFQI